MSNQIPDQTLYWTATSVELVSFKFGFLLGLKTAKNWLVNTAREGIIPLGLAIKIFLLMPQFLEKTKI